MINGHSQNTAWPESQKQNENMFRLPRPLKIKDTVEISGFVQDNPESISFNLTTGINSPDNYNIACRVEVNFPRSTLHIGGTVNGQIDNQSTSEEPDLIGLFPADGEFSFKIKPRVYISDMLLDISFGQANMGSRRLQHNLEDITFLTLDGDVKVKNLKFTFE